jgi:hypothetical protein
MKKGSTHRHDIQIDCSYTLTNFMTAAQSTDICTKSFTICIRFPLPPPVGNCDIDAEQNISFMNLTKQNEIWSRQKVEFKKIFQTLPPNFGKGRNKSYQKFHPFCISWMKVRKMQQIFYKNFESV